MRNFKLLSWARLNRIPQWLPLTFLILSFLGFLDASYLTAEHYLGIPVVCSVLNGCEEVLQSEYATFFGIPVALFGAGYYAAVFLLVVLFLDTKNKAFLKLALLLPLAGFLASLWFVFTQAVLLQAYCLYCMISSAITTTLFILSLFVFFKKGSSIKEEYEENT